MAAITAGRDDIFRGDQLDIAPLAFEFGLHRRADLGVGLCDEADGVHHFFEHGCALLYCFTSCGGFPRLLPNYRLYTRRARRTRRFSLLNC